MQLFNGQGWRNPYHTLVMVFSCKTEIGPVSWHMYGVVGCRLYDTNNRGSVQLQEFMKLHSFLTMVQVQPYC